MSPRSKVKVFFFGNRKSGAWKIRGKQIAATRKNWGCGAKVIWLALKKYDIFVAVKEIDPECVKKIRNSGKILVYDILDSWRQPADSLVVSDIAGATRLFAKKWEEVPANAYIFPNAQMKNDLGALVSRSTVIYHHYYPKLTEKRINKPVRKIGYQGREKFLAGWREPMEKIAHELGVEFVVNPRSLADLDVGIIARGGEHNGFLEQRYKSNVKLANCMACGIPSLILSGGMSYHETWNAPESYFTTLEEFKNKLQNLINNQELRETLHSSLLAASDDYKIDVIAKKYENWLESLL